MLPSSNLPVGFYSTGVKAMKRLLGIIGMIPEVDPSEWDHTDVSAIYMM